MMPLRNLAYRLIPDSAILARMLASTKCGYRYVWDAKLTRQQAQYLAAQAVGGGGMVWTCGSW